MYQTGIARTWCQDIKNINSGMNQEMQDKRQEDRARLRKRAKRRPIRNKERSGGGGFFGHQDHEWDSKALFLGQPQRKLVNGGEDVWETLQEDLSYITIIGNPNFSFGLFLVLVWFSAVIHYHVSIQTQQLPGWQNKKFSLIQPTTNKKNKTGIKEKK